MLYNEIWYLWYYSVYFQHTFSSNRLEHLCRKHRIGEKLSNESGFYGA